MGDGRRKRENWRRDEGMGGERERNWREEGMGGERGGNWRISYDYGIIVGMFTIQES